MNKIIIGLVGEIAAGKGTVVKYLEKKHGASSHRFSNSLTDILNRLYLDTNRPNYQKLSLILRQAFGQDLFAKIITEEVKKDQNKIIVVDGIRRLPDLEYLNELPGFKLVYVTADIKIRYQRILSRTEKDDDKKKTFEDFLKDHEGETELEIHKIGQTAPYKISNDGDEEMLYAQIERILNE